MIFGVSLPTYGHLATPHNIIAVAKMADELGYHSVWAAERLLVPIPPNQSWSQRSPTAFEPLSTLSHIAAITSKIHLCTGVVILPVRNPVLLARVAASIDVLSGGRLELGVGVGWMKEEMEISGVPYGRRGRIADEYIQVMRSLWSGGGFDGEFVKVPPNLFEPKPVHGGIPIWIGGNSDAALNRVARLGDGWIPMGTQPASELRRSIQRIRALAEGYGRDADFQVASNLAFGQTELKNSDDFIERVRGQESIGVSQLIPRFSADSTEGTIELMEGFARKIVPQLA